MLDVCVPFEDFEYNSVGNYRVCFIVLETVFVVHLSVLFFRMKKCALPANLYVQNLLIISWPLLPIRIAKILFIFYDPILASQSDFMCMLLRAETTLQYWFALAHIQMLAFFSINVAKHRSLSFEVTSKQKKVLFSLDIFSFLTSIIFVNPQSLRAIFSCVYTLTFLIAFTAHFILNQAALILSSSFFRRVKENDTAHFSYWWLFTLQSFMTFAHIYQLSGISTFLIPMLFSKFEADYHIMFRSITGALAVKFMVSLVFAVGPVLLLPPVRRQIFKPIRKIYQDRVVPAPEERSPEQVQITLH